MRRVARSGRPISRAGVGRPDRRRRAGFILPVVLVLIGLLALLAAGFMFFTRAEMAGSIANADARQARLAAESGLEEVVSLIRQGRDDAALWFNNPTRLRHALVHSDAFTREQDPVRATGSRAALFEQGPPAPAWRFSAVAPNLDDDTAATIRYGITPESGKLNLNVASDAQIERLLGPLLAGLQIENPQELINALLDWRDADEEVRDGGAENEYYNTLVPPYMAKNGPLDTVEELLLVRGFNAAILYGEDSNRNGLLDPNEDDGDESFPFYDNADGVLNRGLAPYVTVWTREPDTSLDNKPRINLTGDRSVVLTQMATYLGENDLSPATVGFIQGLIAQNFDFSQMRSAADFFAGAGAASGGESGEGGDGGAEGDPGAAGTLPPPLANSPVTLDEMPVIMDRFSVVPAQQAAQGLMGLVNINAAPRQVLELVPGVTPDVAAALVATRRTLDAQALRTTAWPLVAGVVDGPTFRAMAPYVTTKAYQFHVETVGYADHAKLVRRYEWIIEMIGPLPQVKYHRELTRLGPAWPVDDDNCVISAGR